MGHGLSRSVARGILPDHRSNPCLTALAGRFLSTIPPGKSCSEIPGHFLPGPFLWVSTVVWTCPGLEELTHFCIPSTFFSCPYVFIYWVISHTTLFLPCFSLYNFLCISFLSFPKPAFPSRTEILSCELVYFLCCPGQNTFIGWSDVQQIEYHRLWLLLNTFCM